MEEIKQVIIYSHCFSSKSFSFDLKEINSIEQTSSYKYLISIKTNKLLKENNIISITNLSHMFSGCSSLKCVSGISNLNTIGLKKINWLIFILVYIVTKLDSKTLEIDENEFNQNCKEKMNNPKNNNNDEN